MLANTGIPMPRLAGGVGGVKEWVESGSGWESLYEWMGLESGCDCVVMDTIHSILEF